MSYRKITPSSVKAFGTPIPTGRWPQRMGASSLCRWVEEIHSRGQDFDEGNLADRIYEYSQYELRRIDIGEVDPEEWSLDEALAREYAGMQGDFPPILFDAPNQSIIDGTHRVNAALLRGDTTILAYCPILQD